MAAGRAVLRVIEEEGLMLNCLEVGKYFKTKLLELAERHVSALRVKLAALPLTNASDEAADEMRRPLGSGRKRSRSQ